MATRRTSDRKGRPVEITIDQHAVLASGSVSLAVLAVWWAASLEWSEMGRQKIPVFVAAFAVVLAAYFVQRYVRMLRRRLGADR